MFKKIKTYAKLFWQLLKADIYIYNQTIVTALIDNAIFVASLTIVGAYVLPNLGMMKEYGTFLGIGTIASCILFAIYSNVSMFISDLENNKTISALLILPIPSWLVLIKQAVGYAYRTLIIVIMIVPLCKIVLWNKFSLENFAFFKFLIMLLVLNIFGGIFSIFMSSFVKNMHTIETAWTRVIFPLWFFGSSQFSWDTLYEISPILAYINLANPITYMFEGIRSTVLGQAENISSWICLLMIISFTIALGSLGIVKLKKRLDYV